MLNALCIGVSRFRNTPLEISYLFPKKRKETWVRVLDVLDAFVEQISGSTSRATSLECCKILGRAHDYQLTDVPYSIV